MPLFSFEELMAIKGNMSEAEAIFRYQVFGGSARNVMNTGPASGGEQLEIVEKSMCWMLGEQFKADHPDWWNSILEKISEILTQVEDDFDKKTVRSLMRHRDNGKFIWASKFMVILSGTILGDTNASIHAALDSDIRKWVLHLKVWGTGKSPHLLSSLSYNRCTNHFRSRVSGQKK